MKSTVSWLRLGCRYQLKNQSHTLMSSARASIHCPPIVGLGANYAGYSICPSCWPYLFQTLSPCNNIEEATSNSVLFDVIYSKYSFRHITTQCLETVKQLADHSFVNLGVSMSITFYFCSFCVCRWWASVSLLNLQSTAQCMDPSSVSAVTRTWWWVNASAHTCWFFYLTFTVTGVVSHHHSHIADNTVS